MLCSSVTVFGDSKIANCSVGKLNARLFKTALLIKWTLKFLSMTSFIALKIYLPGRIQYYLYIASVMFYEYLL